VLSGLTQHSLVPWGTLPWASSGTLGIFSLGERVLAMDFRCVLTCSFSS
jgi:hypothetical protein